MVAMKPTRSFQSGRAGGGTRRRICPACSPAARRGGRARLPPPTERPRSGAARPPERRRTASSSPLRLSDVLERHHAGPVHSGSANSAAPTGSRAPFRYYLGSEVREDARSGTDGSSTTPARRRSRNPDGPTLHEIPRGTRRTRRRVPMPMLRSERGQRSRERRPQRERC
jgi:hypothetical protein